MVQPPATSVTGRARTVLVGYSVIHAPRELNPLIRELRESGWNVVLLLGWTGPSAELAESQLRSEGFEVIRPRISQSYESEPSTAQQQSIARQSRSSLAKVAPKWMKLIVHAFDHYGHGKAARRHARELFDAVRPDFLLMHNFHSCGRLDNAILATAKKRGIANACVLVSPLVGRSIVRPGRLVQYHDGMTGDSLLVSHYGPVGKLFAKFKSDWVATDDRVSIFAWPLSMILGSWLAGLLPKDLWHSPHEDFDAVFAPSAFSRDILQNSGYPTERVQMLGAPRLDEALDLMRDPQRERDLYLQLGLPAGAPYLLWNLEPSWEHSYCEEEKHWEWVREISIMLRATNVPVVVSLHPLCNPGNYSFLADEFGFKVPGRLGIHQLYPWASLVLTFPCSTNQYATLFAKRVIMYDWFRVFESPRRTQLYSLEGMRLATTLEALRPIVAEEIRGIRPADLSALRGKTMTKASAAIVAAIERLLPTKAALPPR